MIPDFGHADSLITIDPDAVAANWASLDGLSQKRTKTAAVVKADAYGLGAARIAPHLAASGCSAFFVMSLDEGIDLRRALAAADHPNADIICLAGLHQGQQDSYVQYALIPTINHPEQLARISMMARQHRMKIPAVLHLDTGMSRLGMTDRDTDWLIEQAGDDGTAFDGIDLRYVMSHLVSAEMPSDGTNQRQQRAFCELRSFFPGIRASLANSGGVFLGSDFHFDLTRPGLSLYGVHPAGDTIEDDRRDEATLLAPTVVWDARILQLREEPKGAGVGYNSTHILQRDSRILTVGVGYADGYPRCLGGTALVDINGVLAPVIGRISMDSMAIDVTDIADQHLQSAHAVRLIGGAYPITRLARDAKTIPYEILTGLGHRPRRVYQSLAN